mmetsp:Transcript_26970/g.41346  ORF Transcript_26970/g.41346 Transcript_26970/m.41346 type:complete len:339 (+) Transcript_26970:145-1161(+)|eukprot:CAMPEP_0195283906 /NCGR_PEP_ID=MMETSP0707-20130614/2292_1 /TAXON_ID=33640 /ORGANISM="Asterionellopsis glacialis, Strain CCMP134" /LENGTH=338 /DNA_ID=CAMNT_0040343159 /DNA_START=112 /DNA_END=1128 /DNA_ORIENTATION=+
MAAEAEAKSSDDYLEDSEVTSPTVTDGGSVSDEDGNGGWFGDLRMVARCIRNTGEGVAGVITRGAIAVASEFAQLEHDAELEASEWREQNYGTSPISSQEEEDEEASSENLILPWELPIQSTQESPDSLIKYEENQDLMDKVLELSHDENTFLKPFSSSSNNTNNESTKRFVLTDGRIQLIRQLLDIDENLAAIHARLSGRSDIKENVFWKNYFHHCERVRSEYSNASTTMDKQISGKNITTPAKTTTKVNAQTSSKPAPAPISGLSVNSLIPAEDASSNEPGAADDKSYVIASPPTSMNSVFSTTSLGDMVLIGNMANLDTHDEGSEEFEKSQTRSS